MAQNSNLTAAKKAKNDEFYTQSSDIESELKHYRQHFEGQVVYCNCDDPIESNFWHYFYRSFGFLGLKKLISTHYEQDGKSSYALIYEGGHDNAPKFNEGVKWVPLKGNGDFRSPECIEYLKQSDIVVTNPPFSLAREYVKQLIDNKKKFIIIGNKNWITYKEVFPLLMHRKMWIGANNVKAFKQPDGSFKKFGNVGWFTNLSLQKSTDQMVIWKLFDQKEYPAYDNYAAFEVSKVADIPKNTEITAIINEDNLQGWKDTYHNDLTVISTNNKTVDVKIDRPIWGVPITFLDKYNPESNVTQHNLAKEFDILGLTAGPHWNSINLIDDYKDYINPQHIDNKGNASNGGGMNARAGIITDHPKNAYYIADNINGKFEKKYARVLIRAKKGAQF